jgi:hypothetical protein
MGVQNLEVLVENKLAELDKLAEYSEWQVSGQNYFKELH